MILLAGRPDNPSGAPRRVACGETAKPVGLFADEPVGATAHLLLLREAHQDSVPAREGEPSSPPSTPFSFKSRSPLEACNHRRRGEAKGIKLDELQHCEGCSCFTYPLGLYSTVRMNGRRTETPGRLPGYPFNTEPLRLMVKTGGFTQPRPSIVEGYCRRGLVCWLRRPSSSSIRSVTYTLRFLQVFEYFASIKDQGETLMTPADLMRAVVPVFPPSGARLKLFKLILQYTIQPCHSSLSFRIAP